MKKRMTALAVSAALACGVLTAPAGAAEANTAATPSSTSSVKVQGSSKAESSKGDSGKEKGSSKTPSITGISAIDTILIGFATLAGTALLLSLVGNALTRLGISVPAMPGGSAQSSDALSSTGSSKLLS